MENKSALASLTTYRDSDISDEEDEISQERAVSALPKAESTSGQRENSDHQDIYDTSPASIHDMIIDSAPPVSEPGVNPPTQNSSHKTLSKLVSYNDEDLEKEEEDEDYSPGSDYDVEIFSTSYEDDKSTSKEAVQSISRSIQLLSADDIKLPAEPPGRCANNLQEKISRYYQRKLKEGLDMNVVIQQKKIFRNPSIYEKLISFCGINELGTNYPPEIYDPARWGEVSFYEELAKEQKLEMDKRQKEKTKVEFISGTKKTLAEAALDETKKRKSKWDMGAGPQAAPPPIPTVIKSAGVAGAPGIVTLTTAATGTKPTVISAFGTISKKPKV